MWRSSGGDRNLFRDFGGEGGGGGIDCFLCWFSVVSITPSPVPSLSFSLSPPSPLRGDCNLLKGILVRRALSLSLPPPPPPLPLSWRSQSVKGILVWRGGGAGIDSTVGLSRSASLPSSSSPLLLSLLCSRGFSGRGGGGRIFYFLF